MMSIKHCNIGREISSMTKMFMANLEVCTNYVNQAVNVISKLCTKTIKLRMFVGVISSYLCVYIIVRVRIFHTVTTDHKLVHSHLTIVEFRVLTKIKMLTYEKSGAKLK